MHVHALPLTAHGRGDVESSARAATDHHGLQRKRGIPVLRVDRQIALVGLIEPNVMAILQSNVELHARRDNSWRSDSKHAASILRAGADDFSSRINGDGEIRDDMCGGIRHGLDEGLILRLTAPFTVW